LRNVPQSNELEPINWQSLRKWKWILERQEAVLLQIIVGSGHRICEAYIRFSGTAGGQTEQTRHWM